MTMAPISLPSIDVIVVNFCTGSLVVACLESLETERASVPRLRAVVVDNNSPDGSADHIEAAIRAREWQWVVLLRSPANGGFGAGNNMAIRWARAQAAPAELFWLLNPDTEVRPNAAACLARFMATHPAAGIAGSGLLEGDGSPWPYAFRFPNILGELERGARFGLLTRLLKNNAVLRRVGNSCEQVDWVSGASLIVRRDLFEGGLGFDEGYFLYYEETDFCLHARKSGWECWYVPGAVVLHVAGQSTGVTGRQLKLRRLPAYWFQSRRHYFLKNHGRPYAMLADLAWLVGHVFARARQMASGATSGDPPQLLADFLRHSSFAPSRFRPNGYRRRAG
ncbi:MAG: glycosyltransferase family 2 protein [Sphingomonas sp.]|uniref:glycosyltransferase family 2 protein n=1 Tax=Sphingomonas sp. TaxID=28214 RepID=UPI001B0848F5|nr:glycosyltransferase family 2 protein [Sphingomonas sp.]MBO9623883.1 glycosyltransferase family 2 protein [Sphingomonas sp.]